MSTAELEPSKWPKRLRRLVVTSVLMGFSFTLGVAITAYIAIRILLPIAATGMTMGMVGIASASVHETTNALYSGDSAARMIVLTQLKQTFDTQPAITFDSHMSAWLGPALEQCSTDPDPEVAGLAVELAAILQARTLPVASQETN